MIRVSRNNVPIPTCLRTDIASAGVAETSAAIEFFEAKVARRMAELADPLSIPAAKEDGKESKFSFKVYGKKEVKTALLKLFHEKCGYCEIDYYGAPREIDHYRPKARIDYLESNEKKTHLEGYYWLGSDWDNLILACTHCNSLENHPQEIQAMSPSVDSVSGKACFFSLENEADRAKLGESINKENPLLLDPCRDNPHDHLIFKIDGSVTPQLIDGRPSKRGLESIKIYGLRRRPLVEQRKKVARNLLLAIDRLNNQVKILFEDPGNKIARSEIFVSLTKIREEYLIPKQPFLAMSRSIFIERVDLKKIKYLLI